MSGRYIIFILSLLLFFISCKNETEKTELAKVYDKSLYLEDIEDIIPELISQEDSVLIIKNKIDLWVRKQTILKRAELNLTDEQIDIDEIVEDYRASLLIEKYKQEYIKQELDTTISNSEIEKYYNDYPESFTLNVEVVKAIFFKFSKEDINIPLFRQAYNLNNEEKMIALAEESAVKYDAFNNEWLEFSSVLNLLPNNITNAEAILKASKKFQTRDKNNFYFVVFKAYRLKGDAMPLELTKNRIKIILLNKRKTNIVNELERKIYQSDVKNGNIKIFIE